MELKVSNVNRIQKAEIHLNGLTVVVGPNNSGKSTIGRTLFTTIKAITNTNSPQDFIQDKQLRKHIQSLYQRLSALSRKNKIDWDTRFPRFQSEFVRFLQLHIDEVPTIIKNYKLFIDELDIIPRQKSLLTEDLNNIELCVSAKGNSAARLKTELQYMVESEFINRFCSDNTHDSFVELSSEDIARIRYQVSDNIVSKVYCKQFEFIKDATYVESPLYIHLLDALLTARTYREIVNKRSILYYAMVPVHIKDMAEKIMMAVRQPNRLHGFSDLKIENTTQGNFIFDKETQQIMYKTLDGNIYSPINIASGLKSFGLLQLLSVGDFLGPNHMLIWDEPENHLHPEWQIKLAEIFVKLAKEGQPILITTHSPYFLQAVKFYSAKEKFEKYVNYYIPIDKENNLVELEEISNDLNLAFQLLAEPMNKIMEIDTSF
ncbi:MAG: ATP-binding protein [Bacteroidales bacterium]|nr:ATP-binding protein [Bacteroidales bacterium]